MLKLDAEDSDGDDVDKPPAAEKPQKQATTQASENNTAPTNAKPPMKAADWNNAFLKSLNNANDAPVEVTQLTRFLSKTLYSNVNFFQIDDSDNEVKVVATKPASKPPPKKVAAANKKRRKRKASTTDEESDYNSDDYD